jgi:hypothetical protein
MTAPAPAPEARPTGSRRRHETRMSGSGHGPQSRREVAGYALGALGVVFGDIGTSPLYAIKECTAPPRRQRRRRDRAGVLGVLSLVFWSLALVICVKYLGVRAARRQQGRGRHPVAGRAGRSGRAGKPGRAGRHHPAGDVRHRPAVRRRRHHARHLRAGRGRGPVGRRPRRSITWCCRSPSGHPRRAVHAVQRFGTHRIGAVFGWIMAGVVRRASPPPACVPSWPTPRCCAR